MNGLNAGQRIAAPAAFTAARYLFHDMPVREKGWCPYCIVDAFTHFATVAFTLPEAMMAVRGLIGSR